MLARSPLYLLKTLLPPLLEDSAMAISRVAQRKRAGPITQRSVDRNHPLLRTNHFCSLPRKCAFGHGEWRDAISRAPPIAQLVERRTVDDTLYTLPSLGRWFKSGSVDTFRTLLCATQGATKGPVSGGGFEPPPTFVDQNTPNCQFRKRTRLLLSLAP